MQTERFRWISLANMPKVSATPAFGKGNLRDSLNGLPDEDSFKASVAAVEKGGPADSGVNPAILYNQAVGVALTGNDPARAKRMLLEVSKIGDANLQTLIGKIFVHGLGTLKPHAILARLHFVRALEMEPNNHPQRLLIAKELAKGSAELGGMAPDPEWAKELFLDLYHRGDENVRKEVGYYRQNGIGDVAPF